MIFIGLCILASAVFVSFCKEVTELRTRELLTKNHNEIMDLTNQSLALEMENAYRQGFQAALSELKRFDN